MPDVAKNSSLKFHKYFYWFKKRLTLWVTYWYICCGSIFTFGAKFFEPVQYILNQYKFFNLSQFDFLFCFCVKQKNIFGTFDLLFIFPLLLISTLLASPSISSLLFQHPSPYSFYLDAYLVSLEWQTCGFPLDSCPDALPVSHGDLNASSPIFFSYIYTVLVIHFLKLFKSDMYIGPSPSQS